MIAQVKKLETKISTKGTEYLHATLSVGDKDYTYNVFDQALVTTLKQAEEKGMAIEVGTKADGKYINLVSAIFVPAVSRPPLPQGDQTRPKAEAKPITDVDRYRAMAMSYAKDGWCAGKIEGGKLIEFADFFYAYITQIPN